MDSSMERFLKYVNKKESSCWEWIGSIQPKTGYGQFYLNKNINCHRASWILHKGEIPKGLCVLHICDNRKCCNPKHLWLGTHKDNSRDMMRKKRNFLTVGMKNGMCKLTIEKINEIKKLYSSGLYYQKDIALIYDIAQSHVSRIINKQQRSIE